MTGTLLEMALKKIKRWQTICLGSTRVISNLHFSRFKRISISEVEFGRRYTGFLVDGIVNL